MRLKSWRYLKIIGKSYFQMIFHQINEILINYFHFISARFVTKDGRLLSMVLPPPPAVTTGQQFSSYSTYAYCPPYSLVYLLVSCEEIWVYYAKYARICHVKFEFNIMSFFSNFFDKEFLFESLPIQIKSCKSRRGLETT